MTETTATPRKAVPVAEVDRDALYEAAVRAVRVAKAMLHDVDRNPADVHRHTDALRVATDGLWDVLAPPPLPESPEDAVVLNGWAVKVGDKMFTRKCTWQNVTACSLMDDGARVKFMFASAATETRGVREAVAVVRAPVRSDK